MPRTDNALEDTIRALKQRSRRISGRNRGNSYLLRHGRCVAYYEWLGRGKPYQLERMWRGVEWADWRVERAALRQCRSERVKKYRFRQHRE